MVHTFSAPTAQNGSEPAAVASRKRPKQGSPSSSGRREQTSIRAPRSARASTMKSSAQGGMNTSRGRCAARATVAAARAAFPQEAIASGTPAASPAASRCRARPMRWRALWVPVTLPVSSLHPEFHAEASTQLALNSCGGQPEPLPVDLGYPAVEPRHRGDEVGVRATRLDEAPVGPQHAPVTHERVVAGSIDVVRGAGGRSQPAVLRRETVHHLTPAPSQLVIVAPLRVLNSSIMASQAGTMACSRSQNAACRRASKSSTETPCCSTQVK